jgi:eukaryotic-like serine/threonine-protein kinase
MRPGRMLSHYRLLEPLGEGGMGVVWKAEDTVLGRLVAVKILHSDTARDESRRRRFLEEARLASAAGSTNIAPIHELGRDAETDFIVMEYVEGIPLGRLLENGPLAPARVAHLGEQIARALAHAHRKGLLHRDLKPENVLVTPEDEVKVVDFGLAVLLDRDPSSLDPDEELASARASSSPRTSTIAGTLAYMSPEQGRGEPLDGRSDIFSLGVVLYEMVTGRSPFQGRTARELLAQVVEGRHAPPHDLVPRLPFELSRIIEKALAPRPRDRYQTMEDLAVDLRRLGRDLDSGSSPSYQELRTVLAPARRRRAWSLVATGLAVLTAGLAWVWFAGPGRLVRADRSTVLVLPLEVRGQQEGAEGVGRAFAEAVAVHLAQAANLRVLPVPDPASLLRRAEDPAQAALVRGAGRVLAGSVALDEGRVETSLQLLDARRNRILWGARRVGPSWDLQTLARGLASEAALALGASFPRRYDDPLQFTGPPEAAGSLDLIRALAALKLSDFREAFDATENLVRLWPDDFQFRVLRAFAMVMGRVADPSLASREEVEEALGEIARRDPAAPYVSVFRAALLLDEGRPRQAVEDMTRVLERGDLALPLRAWVLRRRAGGYRVLGQLAEARADLEEALRLEPTSAGTFRSLADILRDVGEPELAVEHAQRAVLLEPSNSRFHASLALALQSAGRHADSVAPAKRACEMTRAQWICALEALSLLRAGRTDEAIEVARRTEELAASEAGTYNLACFWALAGDRRRALDLLRRCLDLGLADDYIERDPDLASLRGDPEFHAVLTEVRRRIGR